MALSFTTIPSRHLQAENDASLSSEPEINETPAAFGEPLRVLMIGDSMTVGGFGEGMQEYLSKRFGRNRIAVYGSCGSSPESWLRSEPEFVTRCGYREYTPRTEVSYDFESGRHPQPALTPKIEDLMTIFNPKTVIVQLGTNWMDAMPAHVNGDKSTYSQMLDRVIAAIHCQPGAGRQIIWVTPPDAAHYSNEVKKAVFDLIKSAAQRHSFTAIDSGGMTHYVAGRSGSDGVHYSPKEGRDWAALVGKELDRLVR